MSIRFDSLQFQNNTQYGKRGPIVAEIGVIVDNLPSDDPDYMDVDLPVHADEGYYYVAMICRQDPEKKTFNLDKDKRYVVSKVSVVEYIFGFESDDEMPEFLEDYHSISDAVDSDFLDFFLFENSLIQESIADRAVTNHLRREKAKGYGEGHTSITIKSLEDFRISTRLSIDETKEILHEIIINENSGGFVIGCVTTAAGNDGRTTVSPEQHFKLIENDEILVDVPALEYLFRSDQEYFPAFAKAEKTTKQNVLRYFRENAVELESRFTKGEIEDLKAGILGNGLGIKEYRI